MKSNILRGTQPITNLRLIINILNPSLSTNLGLTMQPGPTHTKELPTEAPRESRPGSRRTELSIREWSTIKKNKQAERKSASTKINMHKSTTLKFRPKNILSRRPWLSNTPRRRLMSKLKESKRPVTCRRNPSRTSTMSVKPIKKSQNVINHLRLKIKMTGATRRPKISCSAVLLTTLSMDVMLSTRIFQTSRSSNTAQTSISSMSANTLVEDVFHSTGYLFTGLPKWTTWAIQNKSRIRTQRGVKKIPICSSSVSTTPSNAKSLQLSVCTLARCSKLPAPVT